MSEKGEDRSSLPRRSQNAQCHVFPQSVLHGKSFLAFLQHSVLFDANPTCGDVLSVFVLFMLSEDDSEVRARMVFRMESDNDQNREGSVILLTWNFISSLLMTLVPTCTQFPFIYCSAQTREKSS